MRSGVGAQLGLATETAYGTGVTPVTFLPFTSESLTLAETYVRTAGLRAGRLGQPEPQHVMTTRAVSGDIVLDMLTKGMLKLLNLLNGDTVTPRTPVGGTTSRQWTFGVGLTDPFGKSITAQLGRPDTGGTVDAFTYLGCKLTQLVVRLDRGGVASGTWTLDAMDEDTTVMSLAVPSYVSAAVPFNFISGSVLINDVLLREVVQSATITIPLAQATDRYGIGSGATKKEPIVNGLIVPTIDLQMEFASMTQQNAFKAATRQKIALNCAGPLIEGSINFALNFTAPKTVVVRAGPTVQGPDILTQSISLECLDDGTNAPLTIDYITTDTAI